MGSRASGCAVATQIRSTLQRRISAYLRYTRIHRSRESNLSPTSSESDAPTIIPRMAPIALPACSVSPVGERFPDSPIAQPATPPIPTPARPMATECDGAAVATDIFVIARSAISRTCRDSASIVTVESLSPTTRPSTGRTASPASDQMRARARPTVRKTESARAGCAPAIDAPK